MWIYLMDALEYILKLHILLVRQDKWGVARSHDGWNHFPSPQFSCPPPWLSPGLITWWVLKWGHRTRGSSHKKRLSLESLPSTPAPSEWAQNSKPTWASRQGARVPPSWTEKWRGGWLPGASPFFPSLVILSYFLSLSFALPRCFLCSQWKCDFSLSIFFFFVFSNFSLFQKYVGNSGGGKLCLGDLMLACLVGE